MLIQQPQAVSWVSVPKNKDVSFFSDALFPLTSQHTISKYRGLQKTILKWNLKLKSHFSELMQSKHRPEGPEVFMGNGKYGSTPARPSSLTAPSNQEMQECNQTWTASD